MDLKKEYIKIISSKTLIKDQDFTDTEKEIINIGFDMVKDKIDEIRELNDEIRRINIELLNLRSSLDDSNY